MIDNKPAVFIGSSTQALETAIKVKGQLDSITKAVIWNDKDVFGLGAGTLESLINAIDKFDFAILIMTPDDRVVLENGQEKFKPRDNVLIEFGLFTGGLGRDRAFALIPYHNHKLHIPTDLAGVTQAPLRKADNPKNEYDYDVEEGCARIATKIKEKGPKPIIENELGTLYRLINAFSFPHYENISFSSLPHFENVKVAAFKDFPHRSPETFDSVDDVISFVNDLLSYYIFPHLKPNLLEHSRVYFAYYIGDGVIDSNIWGTLNPKCCWDKNSTGKIFSGDFVIGIANNITHIHDHNWRVGRPIPGYKKGYPESMCAKVFLTGKAGGTNDVSRLSQSIPNYSTPNEATFYAFPVEWRTGEGDARIGIIGVSSSIAYSINNELQALIKLLANVVGFLFSLYAAHYRKKLEEDGQRFLNGAEKAIGISNERNIEVSESFKAAVVGLRRMIAADFELKMINSNVHLIDDGKLWYKKN